MNDHMITNGNDTADFKRSSAMHLALLEKGNYHNGSPFGDWRTLKNNFSIHPHTFSNQLIQCIYLEDSIIVSHWESQRELFINTIPDFNPLFSFCVAKSSGRVLSAKAQMRTSGNDPILVDLHWNGNDKWYDVTNSRDSRVYKLPESINPDLDFWFDLFTQAISFDDAMWLVNAVLVSE